ncbi:hypothetical protein [Kocuria tytonicola]|uniref:hypothetical protein n=1 Tax=Kocuria tytonicola TaxID=2055946 RepID=UPI001F0C55C6|nr:hypothetical protein [Kocuria tytonicola]
MAKRTLPRALPAAAALFGLLAVTGCSGDSPDAPAAGGATASAEAGAPPTGAGGTASSAPGAQNGVTPAEANSADVYELTQTYTDPDKLFTVQYPKDWAAAVDQGYLELTSPDGKVKGTVASTKARPPKGDWFTRPKHPLIGHETPLGEQLGTKVFTYASYVPAPPRGERSDSVLWGLTPADNKGIVHLKGGDKGDLWAEFHYSPVNEGNRPLSQSKGVELVNEINQTDDAGTVDAILKSVRAGS